MKTLRILIADDHEMVRRGIRMVVETQRGWEICGEARNGHEALTLARAHRPDVVVMDFTMPELNGMEATRRILAELPGTQVLILTMHESEQLVREVMTAGARGFLLKSDAGDALVDAIKAVVEKKTFYTSGIAARVAQGFLNPATREKTDLTPREREIMQRIAEGKSTKELADALGISPKTAEAHRTNLMRKLNLHSVTDVVRYAIRNKLVEP